MTTAGWIAFAIFGSLGAMLLVVGLREGWLQRRMLANARPVEGTVLQAEVKRHESRDSDPSLTRNTSTTSYTAEVRFRYQVDGRNYESDRFGASAIVQGHASKASAAEELAGLVPGEPVTVFVDPRHPELGFLRSGRSAGPTVFVVLGLAIPPLVWWLGHYI